MPHAKRRTLIVNADDFGLSAGVNAGIRRSFLDGVVTSASLMVRQPSAGSAAAISAEHPGLSVGLHIDLGEWVYRGGEWTPKYEVVDLSDPASVRNEVEAQLDLFRGLLGADPTHLDSHQHVHLTEPVRGIVREAGERLGVPVRGLEPRIRYCGEFYGQTGIGQPARELITTGHLLEIIDRLGDGWTELGCHPGEAHDVESDYGVERSVEVRTLTDPRIREGLVSCGVGLAGFGTGQNEVADPAAMLAGAEA
ncbi:MAG: ChbG/HpnK family deacetylase [Gemmatimonadota bacterium]|nr:ChbG/HpnK family deacetylase [Gemmatimonadota bacterium]